MCLWSTRHKTSHCILTKALYKLNDVNMYNYALHCRKPLVIYPSCMTIYKLYHNFPAFYCLLQFLLVSVLFQSRCLVLVWKFELILPSSTQLSVAGRESMQPLLFWVVLYTEKKSPGLRDTCSGRANPRTELNRESVYQRNVLRELYWQEQKWDAFSVLFYTLGNAVHVSWTLVRRWPSPRLSIVPCNVLREVYWQGQWETS